MGFPFFVPAFTPGNRIRIYSCHARLEQALRGQNAAPCFPVEFASLGAEIEFVRLEPGRPYPIAGATVTGRPQRHGGDSYGYRIEQGGKSVVYTTDSEHKMEDVAAIQEFVAFLKLADLVIFDSMYSLADSMSLKEDWGHSSNVIGVELCQMAKAKHLCLFHHEPIFDDARIAEDPGGDDPAGGDHAQRPSAADQLRPRRPGDRGLSPLRAVAVAVLALFLALQLAAGERLFSPLRLALFDAYARDPPARAQRGPGRDRGGRRREPETNRPVAVAASPGGSPDREDPGRAARPRVGRRHPVAGAGPPVAAALGATGRRRSRRR